MKTFHYFYSAKTLLLLIFSFFYLHLSLAFNSGVISKGESVQYVEFKGLVLDKKSQEALAFASISVAGTNTSVVTNSEGLFSIKLPLHHTNPKVLISYIGYKNREFSLTFDKLEKLRFELEPSSVQLPELSVISSDASELVQAVFNKKNDNYPNYYMSMTAFYRETIKRNKSYVSLSEAVVEIGKQPYGVVKSDDVRLFQSRKKTDYSQLDTLTFKLMGGPFSSLYLDVMKQPEMIFSEQMMQNYEFVFDRSIYQDQQLIFVVDFKQRKSVLEPLYFGKLFIDAENFALKSAIFSFNLSNKEEAARMFVLKKPLNARVIPVEATYRIDYQQKNGKWFFGYSRIELGLKIIWKKKFFNTNYFSAIEMSVTDWGETAEMKSFDYRNQLKPSVIISDEASGFSDPKFWGEFNVIEPEKTIEAAIKKIQKKQR